MKSVSRATTLLLPALLLAARSFVWAAAEPVSRDKETEEFGPFLSYETTVTRYTDGTESVKYGKPHWGAPLLNDMVEATVKRGIVAAFSDEYHGPVVNGFYIPAEKEDRFVTTDRDGKVTSASMRRKLSQRVLEGTAR